MSSFSTTLLSVEPSISIARYCDLCTEARTLSLMDSPVTTVKSLHLCSVAYTAQRETPCRFSSSRTAGYWNLFFRQHVSYLKKLTHTGCLLLRCRGQCSPNRRRAVDFCASRLSLNTYCLSDRWCFLTSFYNPVPKTPSINEGSS